jgi:4-aminobutyrate aminotransferase-like enzyme
VGEHLAQGLQGLVDTIPGVLEVRGRGLMRGLGVDPDIVDRAAVLALARDKGLLLTTAGKDALRMVPPLIIGPSHADQALEALRAALMEA